MSLLDLRLGLPEQKVKLKFVLLIFFFKLKSYSFSATEHFFPFSCPDKISKPEVTVSFDM